MVCEPNTTLIGKSIVSRQAVVTSSWKVPKDGMAQTCSGDWPRKRDTEEQDVCSLANPGRPISH